VSGALDAESNRFNARVLQVVQPWLNSPDAVESASVQGSSNAFGDFVRLSESSVENHLSLKPQSKRARTDDTPSTTLCDMERMLQLKRQRLGLGGVADEERGTGLGVASIDTQDESNVSDVAAVVVESVEAWVPVEAWDSCSIGSRPFVPLQDLTLPRWMDLPGAGLSLSANLFL
jgi:hypothetical protein